jgi:DNA-binding transcriptional regulator LsrR (DeoR family)
MNKKRSARNGEAEDGGMKALIAELQSVKLLLMLQALAIGYKQKHLASMLGVSEATLSRMMPKGFSKELAKIVESRSSAAAEG